MTSGARADKGGGAKPSGPNGGGGRSGGLLGFAVLAAAVLPLTLAPVRASWLGADGRGAFAYFQSSLVVIAATGTLGVRLAAYSLAASGDRRFRHRLAPTIARALAASSAIAVPLAIIGFTRVSPFVGLALLGAVALVPGWVTYHAELASAQLLHQDRRTGVGMSVASVVEFTLNLITVLARSLTLLTSIAISLVAEACRTLVASRWRRIDRARLGSQPVSDGVPLSRASVRFAPGSILPVLASNAEVLLYGALLPAATVGVYVVSKLGFSLFLPVASAMEGRFVSSVARRGPGLALRWVAGGGLLAALGISLGARALIPPLFGPEFADAVWGVPVAATAGVVRFAYVGLVSVASSRGMFAAVRSSSMVLLGATLLAATGVVLFAHGTLSAMVVALAVAQVCGFAAVCWEFRRARYGEVQHD